MTAKNRKFRSALLALVGTLIVAIGVWGGQANLGGVAKAAAPVSQTTGSQAAANAPSAPNTTFSTPDLVSWPGEYDNFSGIAASNTDGHVAIDWGAAPDESTGTLYYAWNTAFNLQTDIEDIDGNDPGLINCKNQFGPCPIAIDNANRTHLLYWDYSPGFCIHYVLVNPDGNIATNVIVPNSCGSGDSQRKLLTLAVDNNLTVHIGASRDNKAVTRYWARDAAGNWIVDSESVPQPCGATGDLTMAVSTNGVVMLGFKDCGVSGAGSDIWTATRTAPDTWQLDDISSPCCSNCPSVSKAYLPNLAAAPDGGLRIVWSDGRCPDNEGAKPDIYYREWNVGTGWNNTPIVRVAQNSGTSYHNALAVDASGEAHIVWADDTSSPFAYYRTFYSHGRGTTFSPVELPFDRWAPGSWQRDVAIASGFGFIHVSFSTVKTDPGKDVYYSWAAAGPLVTPTPTNTPTATATPTPPCLGQSGLDFQDVCSGSTFYDAVHYAFTQAIMTGYPCGGAGEPCAPPDNKPYFRVNNSATRGQLAKVVVLGADLNVITPTVSYFQDVPVGSTFFPYVETAVANGVVSGYACGGTGEPCVPPGNKPYYRPNATVTRGQLSKMVSTAFNFTEPVSGQTFEDVPSTNTFYQYVQRLSARNIINGYPCGNPEPCVAPGNRPYFRPGNNVTRGQTAAFIFRSAVGQPTATPLPTNTPVSPPSCVATVIVYGLTSSGNLISFDAGAPATLLSNDAITGLATDERLVGIDFRPATGQLYGLGSMSNLYTLNLSNGVATQVGASGAFTLTGTYFGFDFNPMVDRIRVVSDLGQNIRLNPNDGTLSATDTALAYATGDPNETATPAVSDAAYTNSYSGTGSTVLYDIDSDLDILALQAPPNNGTLTTTGALGISVEGNGGFDIRSCNNDAYASFTLTPNGNGAASSGLYTLNLTTGAATLVGVIGGGNITVDGVAIAPEGLAPAPTTTPTATATTTAIPTGTPFAKSQPSK